MNNFLADTTDISTGTQTALLYVFMMFGAGGLAWFVRRNKVGIEMSGDGGSGSDGDGGGGGDGDGDGDGQRQVHDVRMDL